MNVVLEISIQCDKKVDLKIYTVGKLGYCLLFSCLSADELRNTLTESKVESCANFDR